MPIRVLQHNLIHGFENMNPDFWILTTGVVDNFNLDTGIVYTYAEEPAKPHLY